MAGSSVRIVQNNTVAVTEAVHQSVSDAVRGALLDLLAKSVERAPIKDGFLRGSGSAHLGGERIATGADFDPEAISGEAVEGGEDSTDTKGIVAFNTPYAVTQHERTDFHHPNGGEAKFLERPAEESREEYASQIATAVKDAIT